MMWQESKRIILCIAGQLRDITGPILKSGVGFETFGRQWTNGIFYVYPNSVSRLCFAATQVQGLSITRSHSANRGKSLYEVLYFVYMLRVSTCHM